MATLVEGDRWSLAAPSGDPLEARIVEAMLDCIGRWGVAKTTADDIARTAGVSRATMYRAFPGGKGVAFEALLQHEARRFFELVTTRLDAARTLEDLVVAGALEAASFLSHHQALRYVMAHEPQLVMPWFAFHRLEPALRISTSFTAPHLRRFLPDDHTARTRAEWLVRILLSYAAHPAPWLDLTDEASVRRFVTIYVLPVLSAAPHLNPGTAPKEH